MTSPLFGESDAWMDTPEEGGMVGVYPAIAPQEPDGEVLTRRAQAKQDGLRLWVEVQKEMARRA